MFCSLKLNRVMQKSSVVGKACESTRSYIHLASEQQLKMKCIFYEACKNENSAVV